MTFKPLFIKSYYFYCMKVFFKSVQILWRLWFGLIVFAGLAFFFPILWALLLHKSTYKTFHLMCRIWSNIILFLSGFFVEVEFEEELNPEKAYIICPNHVSYLDIPLIFVVMPGVFVFIGKKSLSKLPLFGWVYKKTMILVDRSSKRSSYDAFRHASERVAVGVGIAIYPEGGIPHRDVKLQSFKTGAFRMAIEQKVDLVPVTFLDNKRRFPSDHLDGSPGRLRVFVHKPITSGTYHSDDVHKFKSDVYEIINNKLLEDESR
mgnify:CR=1 FL=1